MRKNSCLQTFFCFLHVALTLEQQWVLYAEEIVNTFPLNNWNHPEPPLLSCRTVIPPYQPLWDFSGQVWQRQLNLESERGLTKVFIMFDLYVLGVTDAFSLNNQINVEFDGVIQQISQEQLLMNQSNQTYCNSLDQYYSLFWEFDVSEKTNFNFVFEIAMPNFQYSLKNFIVQIQKCQENCYKCDSFFKCEVCKPTYQLFSQHTCLCSQPLAFTYNNQCVATCPVGYYLVRKNQANLCKPYLWKQQILSFNNFNFTYIQDNLSNTYYQNNLQQENIYRFNDKVIFSVSKSQSTTSLEIEAEFQWFGDVSVWTTINIGLNNINFDKIRYYLDHVSSLFGVIAQNSSCTHQLFLKCLQIKYIFVIAIESKDIEIEFGGNFNISDSFQAWSLVNLKINEIQIQPSVTPSCTLKYEDECVTTCPTHSTQNGNICEDYGSAYVNPHYQVKSFYQISKSQYNDYVEANYDLDYFPLFYYKNRLIQQIQNRTITYNFILAPHKKIKFFLSVLLIDWQTSDDYFFFQIKFAQQQQNYRILPNVLNKVSDFQIGQEFNDYLYSNFTAEFIHVHDYFDIQFICSSPYNARCGLFDFFLIIDKCNQQCKKCDLNNYCLVYSSEIPIEQISYNQNNYQCMDGYFYEKSKQLCSNCDSGCLKCNTFDTCVNCKQNLLNIGNKCYCPISKTFGDCYNSGDVECPKQCEKGIQYATLCNFCDISQFKISSLNQCQCMTGYFMNSECDCTKCSEYCLTCSDKYVCTQCVSGSNREIVNKYCQCKQGYFENKDEIVCQECSSLCKQCTITTDYCFECFTEQFRVLSNHICICKQGYYEDQNNICQQCNSNCLSCYDYDKCLSCAENRMLKSKNCICKQGYYEDQLQNCQSCHYSCSKCNDSNEFNQCTECPISRFQSNINLEQFSCKCLKGYYDIEQLECISCSYYQSVPIDHVCYSNCGDLIVQWNEECDDGNLNTRDGCDQCYYQSANCDPNICKSCLKGQCSECLDGYYLNMANKCELCSQNCITCSGKKDNCTECAFKNEDSTCKQCDSDKGYQVVQNFCVSVCGDNLKVANEECDDGNVNSGDGCNQYCQIEDGFVCNNECELIVPILMIVSTSLSDKYYENIRNIKLQFNQQVIIDGNLAELIDLQLLNSNISINITKNIEVEQEVLISIEFEDSISNPLIQISVIPSLNITNYQGISLSTGTEQITLLSYFKQSQTTIATVQSSIEFANIILYILIGLAGFSFLTGGLNIFFNLLDTLQTLAYLKYFNIVYPFNVNTYFSLFGFAEFDFLKEYIAVNFEVMNLNSLEQIPPDQKFVDEGYSSLFLLNILSVASVFLTTLCMFMLSKLLYNISDRILQHISNSIAKDIYYNVSKFTYYFYQSLKQIRKQCRETGHQLKNNLILTFMASAMDLNMAIFLQLKSYSDVVLGSYLLSLVLFIIEFTVLYKCYNIVQKPNYEIVTIQHQEQYQALSEGVKQQNQIIKMYSLIVLMKKILFMFCLIFLYSQPFIQVGTISILNIAYIGYLTISNPLQDKTEYQKVIISETILWLEQLLVILMLYIQDIETNEIIGWLIIGFSSILLILQLIIDVKQHFIFLYQQYRIFKRMLAYVKRIFNNDESETQETLVEIPIQQKSIQTFNLGRNFY